MIKLICYLFAISLMVTSCTDATSTTTNNGADSIKKETAADRDVYQEEQEIKKMISNMSQLCENAITMDTSFMVGKDSILVVFSHSCTGDSFPIPARYLEPYHLDHFMAYPLRSEIIVEKNRKRILYTKITKDDFISLLDHSLNKYGVLLYPDLEISGDTINISYSISIPLTDVGIGVRATILIDGNIHFGRN